MLRLRPFFLLALLLLASVARSDVLTFDYENWLTGGAGPFHAGSDVPWDACITSDGALAIVARTDQGTLLRTGLILIYPRGASAPIVRPYTPTFGGRVNGTTYTIAPDSAGNFYAIVSYTSNNTFQSFTLLKYHSDGTLLWSREFASFMGYRYGGVFVRTDSSGNALVAYTCDPTFSGHNMVNVVKYLADGTLAWWNSIDDSPGDDNLLAWTLDESGNPFALTARELGTTGVFDLTLTRFSSTGPVRWKKDLGVNHAGDSGGAGLATLPDGSAVVMAQHDQQLGGRLYLARFAASDGTNLWTDWNGEDPNGLVPRSLIVSPDHSIYAAGQVNDTGPTFPSSTFVRKYDENGARPWRRVFATWGQDAVQNAALDAHGYLHLACQVADLQDVCWEIDGQGNLVRESGYGTGGLVLATDYRLRRSD